MSAKRHGTTPTEADGKSQLYKDVQHLLKHWTKASSNDLLDHLLIASRVEVQHSTQSPTKRLLLDALDALASNEPELARLLRLHFLDQMKTHEVAQRQNMAESTVYRKQKAAIRGLTDIIYALECNERQARQLQFQRRLPPPSYARAYGIEQHIDQLFRLLGAENRPYLISVEGIGGIGKTTLVHALMRRAIEQFSFADYGWISLKQQRLIPDGTIEEINPSAAKTSEQVIMALADQLLADIPAPTADRSEVILHQRLKSRSHLLVIDNLETLEDYHALLPLLQKLSNPSTIIVTSRKNLEASSAAFPYKVPELKAADALKLIRYEAGSSGLGQLAAYNDAELLPIYAVVGGNPLALKLVVGQLTFAPLSVILEALKEAQGESIENLYTFIYQRAWDSLESSEKEILLGTIALPEEGGDFARLQRTTDTDSAALYDALRQLVALNLVDRHQGDTMNSGWYRIHSLTRSFLYKQVLGWQ